MECTYPASIQSYWITVAILAGFNLAGYRVPGGLLERVQPYLPEDSLRWQFLACCGVGFLWWILCIYTIRYTLKFLLMYKGADGCPTMMTIEDLPDEMLEHIMSFLSLPDRKNARLVCLHWRDVSYSPGLTKNDVLNIGNHADLADLNCISKYAKIKIGQKTRELIGEGGSEFWSSCGEHVQYLFLRGVVWSNRCLYNILPHTPNLKVLDLTEIHGSPEEPLLIKTSRTADYVTPPQCTFQSLRCLSIVFAIDFPFELWIRIVENAPLLEAVTIYSFAGTEKYPFESFLFVPPLKRLRIYGCRLNDAQLTTLLSNQGSQMWELFLDYSSKELTDACLPVIATKLPNLISISLGEGKITNEGKRNLLRSLKHLTNFDFPFYIADADYSKYLLTLMDLKRRDIVPYLQLRFSINNNNNK